jgi:hypothetical protein
MSGEEEEDFYIVVWQDGSYIIADGRLQANEYEQDGDWLATFSLNEMVARALLDKGHVNISYAVGASGE